MSATKLSAPEKTVPPRPLAPSLGAKPLPALFPPTLLAGVALVAAGLLYALGWWNPAVWAIVTAVGYMVLITAASALVENRRKAKDRLVTAIVYTCFGIAMVPLVSLLWTVLSKGLVRLDGYFLTVSMNGVTPSMDAGGAYHAILGTLLMTLMAALISVPIGLMTAIYLVEYGQGRLKRAITFFVDVMTGIPSIVAGLFVVALWILLFGPGKTNGAAGAISLSVLRGQGGPAHRYRGAHHRCDAGLGAGHRRDRPAHPHCGLLSGRHQRQPVRGTNDEPSGVHLLTGAHGRRHQLRACLGRGADADHHRDAVVPRRPPGLALLRPEDAVTPSSPLPSHPNQPRS